MLKKLKELSHKDDLTNYIRGVLFVKNNRTEDSKNIVTKLRITNTHNQKETIKHEVGYLCSELADYVSNPYDEDFGRISRALSIKEIAAKELNAYNEAGVIGVAIAYKDGAMPNPVQCTYTTEIYVKDELDGGMVDPNILFDNFIKKIPHNFRDFVAEVSPIDWKNSAEVSKNLKAVAKNEKDIINGVE